MYEKITKILLLSDPGTLSNLMDLKTRQERLVFVDPEDEEIPYWWPAIVVPEEEYELFKETMDNDAGVNVGEHERLVCYFEDGSFSVVPKSGLIPFHPQREPYKSYSTRLKHFLTDAGIRRATDFHSTGKIPKMFKWLILGETGYLEPMESEEEEEAEGVRGGGKGKGKGKGEREQDVDAEGIDIDLELELEQQEESTDQVVKRQKSTTIKVVKNGKRGRKPKNQKDSSPSDNNNNNNVIVMSPKPVNPSDAIKIESLITNMIQTDSQEITCTTAG